MSKPTLFLLFLKIMVTKNEFIGKVAVDAGFSQDAVKKGLKDPDSAKFQNLRLTDYGNGKVVCGEVNAKNSYGGYVGHKRFVAGTSSATIYSISSKYQNINEASNAGIIAACGY